MSHASNPSFIRGNLLHLSYNMWYEADAPPDALGRTFCHASPRLRFDEDFWRELTRRMADKGFNMVVLDLGDGVRYASHPEIAVEGAWPPQRLRDEAARLKEMGLELIPKLNFSTAHDEWLGPYARCVSTPAYYRVCRDLIDEVIDILDKPRLFHLGMDEETAYHQTNYNYVVVRQHELFWHDLLFLIERVDRRGVRPWIWSDLIWKHEDDFLKRVPRSVLQSNWYYGRQFDFSGGGEGGPKPPLAPNARRAEAYRLLESAGFDQVPTCSNHDFAENTPLTVKHVPQWIKPRRLKGFLQTSWLPTTAEFRDRHFQAIDLLAEAVA